MDILSNLFGSEARVKIMRLFLFNPNQPFDITALVLRTKLRKTQIRKEVNTLVKVKLLKKRNFRQKGRKAIGWILNPEFQYLSSLRELLLQNISLQKETVLKKLNKIGRLKGVVLSGVFIQDWDSRADILVIADRIKRRILENLIKNLEAEIGREIKYVALETADFQYRMSMGDKLLRDILDYPHQVALDRLGLLG